MSITKTWEYPVHLFHEGKNHAAYNFFGSRYDEPSQRWIFRVWVPDVESVSVCGDFNGWSPGSAPMTELCPGIWECRLEGISPYMSYKYFIKPKNAEGFYKSDPYAYHFELRPGNASKTFLLPEFEWHDAKWLQRRALLNPFRSPVSIYEVHAGSWRRYPDGNFFDYEKLGDELAEYAKKMGFTHVELLPLAEHPLDMSWGYQVTGYYAPTSRFGTPDMLMRLVDRLHTAGIGVILDWVPAHFPNDECGLRLFNGGCQYEYCDPRKAERLDWGTTVFDFGKNEVRSFLISNALYWFDKYHIDGLRIDAVASMLYLDYGENSRFDLKNEHGGNQNTEAAELLKQLNTAVLTQYTGALMIAEESTSWPMVTRPPYDGGLGFNYKWNMGWMNDILDYMSADPFFRKDMHDKITFSLTYAFSENYILPLSHDECVHGKRSLIDRMPGGYEEKFPALRTLYAYMYAHPGKKLLFMGGEFAQFREWDYAAELEWFMLGYETHAAMQCFVAALNRFYHASPPLWEIDDGWEGFRWLIADDNRGNTAVFTRIDRHKNVILCAFNFSPIPLGNYEIPFDRDGTFRTVFSTEDARYGGIGLKNNSIRTKKTPDGRHITLSLPAYSAQFFSFRPKEVSQRAKDA